MYNTICSSVFRIDISAMNGDHAVGSTVSIHSDCGTLFIRCLCIQGTGSSILTPDNQRSLGTAYCDALLGGQCAAIRKNQINSFMSCYCNAFHPFHIPANQIPAVVRIGGICQFSDIRRNEGKGAVYLLTIFVLVVTVSTVTRICRSASAQRIVIQLGSVNQRAVVDQIIRDQLDIMARSFVSTLIVCVPIPADGQGLAGVDGELVALQIID